MGSEMCIRDRYSNRLAAARFADDGQCLARVHIEADAAHCLHNAAIGLKIHMQVFNLQQRLSHTALPSLTLLLALLAWAVLLTAAHTRIQRVSQAVAQQIECQHCDAN